MVGTMQEDDVQVMMVIAGLEAGGKDDSVKEVCALSGFLYPIVERCG